MISELNWDALYTFVNKNLQTVCNDSRIEIKQGDYVHVAEICIGHNFIATILLRKGEKSWEPIVKMNNDGSTSWMKEMDVISFLNSITYINALDEQNRDILQETYHWMNEDMDFTGFYCPTFGKFHSPAMGDMTYVKMVGVGADLDELYIMEREMMKKYTPI